MKLKLLIFIVSYNAEKTIIDLLSRIPKNIQNDFDTEILIIDDFSTDNTFNVAKEFIKNIAWCKTYLGKTPENLGYGGNQKLGYLYAINNQFDYVCLLHGDAQYAPEHITDLIEPLKDSSASIDLILGSRMINKFNALKGKMPFYKFIGNIILTKLQNYLLSVKLHEFHTGFRIYSVKKLKEIPFLLNTNNFHFDTEIIVQLIFSKSVIKEIPIKTFYGNEICHVNGLRYAMNVLKSSIKSILVKKGIFFDPKFYFSNKQDKKNNYESKLNFFSTHSVAMTLVKNNSVVLDIGCGDGFISKNLVKKNCKVYACDFMDNTFEDFTYYKTDLNNQLPNISWEEIDYILILDVIEHLTNPEEFINNLIKKINIKRTKVIVSTGNVCFFVTRLMMMLGQFNYGTRGILDRTHTRLFTIASFRRLFKYARFAINKEIYIPAPFPLALNNKFISSFLLKLNIFLLKILPGVFSYQVLFLMSLRDPPENIIKNMDIITNR